MFRIGMPLVLLAGAMTLAVLNLGNAQTPPNPDAGPPQAYRPSFGDLMTIAVQPRHTKLGLAGQERNWTYAAYELRELQGAFDEAPLEDVAAAIRSSDAAKFAAAYAQLTATCNACHQSTDHAAVVVQVPKASSYPDQDFRAPKP